MPVHPPQESYQERPAASEMRILDVERAYDPRPGHRQAEHLRIIYTNGRRAGELRASISWQALAQMRSEMSRAGRVIEDEDVLGLVLVPWALDQLAVKDSLKLMNDEELILEFGDAPKPPAVRETLLRYGLL